MIKVLRENRERKHGLNQLLQKLDVSFYDRRIVLRTNPNYNLICWFNPVFRDYQHKDSLIACHKVRSPLSSV